MPLPLWFRPHERPDHPALQHLRDFRVYQSMDDEDRLRRVAAGYFGLITHLDEQMGEVMQAAESAGLLDRTRIMYTSDHGESFGNHGIFGKNHLLEPAARVPMLMCGPQIPENQVINEITQSVDLFPTIVAGAGGSPASESNRHGESLWPAIAGEQRTRTAFAEFHASGSLNGSFMWRRGFEKLIYHVGMPAQFYDLKADPTEGHDLAGTAKGRARAAKLEAELREFVNPEAVDARAKADQSTMVERFGGEEAVRKTGTVIYTPPPGVEARVEPIQPPRTSSP